MHFHHLLSFSFRVSLISWDFASEQAQYMLYTCAQYRRREDMCASILKILLTEKCLILNICGNVHEDGTSGRIPATFFLSDCTAQILLLKICTSHVFWNVKFRLYFHLFSRLPGVTQWSKQNFRNSKQPQNHNPRTYAHTSQALRIIRDNIAASINQDPFNPGTCFISDRWKNQWYSLPCSFRLPYSSK